MKKSHAIATACVAASLAALLLAYVLASRVTALMAVRFAFRQARAPVNVSSARWQWRWADLRRGRIESISFIGDVAGLVRFDAETPVEARRDGEAWVLTLSPRLRLGMDAGDGPLDFPELSGPVILRIDPEKGFSAAFRLAASSPYELQRPEGGLAAGTISLEGGIDIHGKALVAEARLKAGGLQILWGSRFMEKPKLDLEARIETTLGGEPAKIRVTKLRMRAPWTAAGNLSIGGGPVSGALTGSADASSLLGDAAALVPEAAEALAGASAKGRISYDVKFRGEALKGRISADLPRIEFPAKGIRAHGVKLNHALGGMGRLEAAGGAIGPFAMGGGIHVATAETEDGVSLVVAAPFQLEGQGPLKDASIHVGSLSARIPKGGSPEAVSATASLSGTAPIAGVQRALCIAPDRLLPGLIRLDYRHIALDGSALRAQGRAEGALFGGWARIGDVRVTTKGHTEVETEAFLENADLKFLAEWLRFGKVTGRLDIALKNAAFAVGAMGTIPVRYDFSMRGRSDEGKNLNFSSQALGNLMDMMGVDTPVLSVQMGARRMLSDVFGFINDIDYFGFHARTQLGYTTLETFDPAGSKNHYLIHGTSFKMPLKSTMGEGGTYPVVMKTESFQTWLWSRVTWFRNRSKEQSDEKNTENHPECHALW